jgi:hypothetical protein
MATASFPRKNSIDFPLKRLTLILTALVYVAVLLATQTPKVVNNAHSVEKHGLDAQRIQSCINSNGPEMVYKDKFEPDKFYFLCQLDDGRWGMQVNVCDSGDICEKTSFVKGNGTWKELMKYLFNKATKFTGVVK